MPIELLLENLTNPALLFFVLGILAVHLKSDLEIPANSSKFISLYLLFAIGFKGGQELAHSTFTMEIVWSMVFGIFIAGLIPLYSFFILKRRLNIYDSAAIAAAYGSVSAVTFVTAATYLENMELTFGGHMVAVMALMEAPSIIIGVVLIRLYAPKQKEQAGMKEIVRHALTNGSVVLILGSLIIGILASEQQAQGIKPFTTDLFKGFLAIFLLDMGIISGRKLKDFIRYGWFTPLFGIIIPLINGCLVAWLSGIISDETGNRFIFAILAASASYIAVPAAMKIAAPQANPGLYLPMALAVTFPFNITFGMPIFMYIIGLS
jgi:uncharacterized protein